MGKSDEQGSEATRQDGQVCDPVLDETQPSPPAVGDQGKTDVFQRQCLDQVETEEIPAVAPEPSPPPTKKLPWNRAIIGKIIGGKYEVKSQLGRGGMSAVYLVMQVLMKKQMALKMLHTHLMSDEKSLMRFQQEAQAASKLDHPNIIGVIDFGISEEEDLFLVMDYIKGVSLSQEIRKSRGLPVNRAIPIFIQACDALEHAHKNGVIHRDIKPSNIMLVDTEKQNDVVKIVDFGIAKLLPQEGEEVQQLTQTGDIFGSPLYMSPEQCNGKPQDARSDIYSLGCVFYETLTGNPPLVGDTTYATMMKHINEVPEGLEKFIKDKKLREPLELIIYGAMAKDPARRYQSMERLRADLELFAKGSKSGFVGKLFNLYNLAQLKKGPQRKVVPAWIFTAIVVPLLILICISSWFATSVFFAPENENFYRAALWPKYIPEKPQVPKMETAALEAQRELAEIPYRTAKNFKGDRDLSTFYTCQDLIKWYTSHGLYARAIPKYEFLIEFKQTFKGHPDQELAEFYQDLANAYCLTGQTSKAEESYENQAKALMEVYGEETSSTLLGPLNKLLQLYTNDQNLIQLNSVLKRLITVGASSGSGDKSPGFGLLYCKSADVYRRLAKRANPTRAQRMLEQTAKAQFEEAAKIWREGGLPPDDQKWAYYWCGKAMLASQQGLFDAATTCYERALKVLEKSPGPDKHDLAVFLSNYSDFLWSRKNYGPALVAKARAGGMKFMKFWESRGG